MGRGLTRGHACLLVRNIVVVGGGVDSLQILLVYRSDPYRPNDVIRYMCRDVGWKLNVQGQGGHVRHEAPEKIFVVPLHFFAAQVVLASAFAMVSTVWSVSCLLFFYSRCPPCPAICKSGRGHVPP